MGVKDVLAKGAKWGAISGLVAGGLAALPFIVMSTRSSRRYDPDALPPPPDPELTQPLPQVMDYGPAEGHSPQEWQTRMLARRGGLNRGVDPMAPSLQGPAGNSAIDGKPIQDLGTPAASRP